MNFNRLLIPIRALFTLCMDLTTMSNRKYADPGELFTEAIQNIAGKAHYFNEFIKRFTEEKEFKDLAKEVGFKPDPNTITNGTLQKITPILGQMKELPESVRHILILILIMMEGDINYKDILPDDVLEDFKKEEDRVAPLTEEIVALMKENKMKEAYDLLKKSGHTQLSEGGHVFGKFHTGEAGQIESAREVLERAKQLLRSSE